MKQLTISILLILIVTTANCQDWMKFYKDNLSNRFEEINWTDIELKMNSNEKLQILNSSKAKELYRLQQWTKADEKYLDCLHFTYLNSDNKIDLIVLAPSSVGPILEVFINIDNDFVSVFSKGLSDIELKLIVNSPENKELIFSITAEQSSAYPHSLFSKYQIKFISDKTPEIVKILSVNYNGATVFPSNFNMDSLFLVTQTNYNLRQTPKIEDNNIIMQFTKGDKGHGLAQETDNTGRIWWFVIMDNNIYKDNSVLPNYLSEYGLQNKELNRVFGKDEKWFGWISSRFIEKLR
jgi:hypothetical protein